MSKDEFTGEFIWSISKISVINSILLLEIDTISNGSKYHNELTIFLQKQAEKIDMLLRENLQLVIIENIDIVIRALLLLI